MGIGTNLAAVNYWGTEAPFIDRMKTSGEWVATDPGYTRLAGFHLDASGNPVSDNSNITSFWTMVAVDPHDSSPDNQYVLTYSGTATVRLWNATVISSVPGKVVFEVQSESNGFSDVQVTFRGLNSADPIHDLHVVRTDQVDLFNAGEIFNPDFVAKVAQWDVVRFMDWGDTNSSEAVNWANRTELTDRSWAGEQTLDGVPLEAMVKLANEAHVDMWYNVPTKADDAYVTQALTYIRDHLAAGLKVHVEWSNEVWNRGFAANTYAQDKANALWGVDANHDGAITGSEAVDHGANVYYGYRSAQIASIAHQVFGTEAASRLVDVLAGQAAGSGALTSYILPGVAKAAVGSVTSLFHDYAIAPYFGDELSQPANASDHDIVLGWARSGSAGVAAALHELEFGGALTVNQSLGAVSGWIDRSQASANTAGLDLVAYEGGVSLSTSRYSSAERAEIQAFFRQLTEDPRMGDLYTKLVNEFTAHGGTEFLAFNDAQSSGTSGNWGVLDGLYDHGSPRYDALVSLQTTSRGQPTVGADTIHAKDTGGTINALGGNDKIYAGLGNDTIDGGDGNDVIIGSSGSTDARGRLIEVDYYLGGTGSDTITGGTGNDHIYGYEVNALAGFVDAANRLSGGDGNDLIWGDGGGDTMDGGNGSDQLYGAAGNDWIDGGPGDDYLQGSIGNDVLVGGLGNDILRGGNDDDRLDAGDGDDLVSGEAGYDMLSGGAGRDTFTFSVGQTIFSTKGVLPYAMDEITDFQFGSDKIALGFHVTQVLQGAATTIANAAVWAAQALTAHAGVADVAAVSVGTDTILFYDDTGRGGVLDAAIKIDAVAATGFSAIGIDFG